MSYRDFVLRISPGAGSTYAVEVASPAGEGHGLFEIPEDLEGSAAVGPSPWEETLRDVAVAPPAGPADARRTGISLFSALFTGEVLGLFRASLSGLPDDESGLRIRLELDPRSSELLALHELPWELLCRPETKDFLSRSRRTPIVRTLPAHREHRPPIPAASGLRILVIRGNPAGSAHLQIDRELRNLEEAWKGKKREVTVTFLERGGREELRRAFLASPFHVLHFLGHGRFDDLSGEGTLLMELASGAAQAVGGEELAEELKDFEDLRLVVLNACQTARTGRIDALSGVATAQVMSGVPAVVAMRRPISDRSAVAFSRVLYDRLASGDPIEAAVTEARLAIDRLSGGKDDWSTPVLFLRGPDGHLFASVEKSPGRLVRRVGLSLLAVVLAVVLILAWMQDRRESEADQHNNQALALMSEGRNDEARRELLAALAADPDNSAAHANLSVLAEGEGRYEEALDHARAAVVAAPDAAVHHYNLGSFLARLGRDEEALASLRRSVNLDPRHAPAWNELGGIYLRLDRPAEARRALAAGLRADRALPALSKNLALVDLAEGRADAAVPRLEKALSLYGPDDPQGRAEALYHLAEAHNQAGRREAACRRLQDMPLVGPWTEKAGDLARRMRCGGAP